MLANGKPGKPHLVLRSGASSQAGASSLPRPQARGKSFRQLPAMADSVLLLQVLLAGPVVNLRSVAEVIRNDVGLTVELLMLVHRNTLESSDQRPIGLSVAENVVHAGADCLRTLAGEIEPLTSHPYGKSALRECERFWGQARLTALMAEELAFSTPGVGSEEAYVAGLLFHLAELPSLLGWESEGAVFGPAQSDRIPSRQWCLPEPLEDIICHSETRIPIFRRLLDVVREADKQTRRIEGLVKKFARGVF